MELSGARVSLVDDAAAVRAAAATLLPEGAVVSTHSCVEDLLDASPAVSLVLVEVHLRNQRQPSALHGVEAVTALTRAGYDVCVYTREERPHVLASCLAAGARGVVSKSLPLTDLPRMLDAVAAGEPVAPAPVLEILGTLRERGHLTLLTDRQREVLGGRARGLTYAQLARDLFVSSSTLRGYWREITEAVGRHLAEASPGDIEHALGLRPGDLLDRRAQRTGATRSRKRASAAGVPSSARASGSAR
ncbi:response regulator transcription factor [Nocardioides lijunqiniae]|uniref:response regulator transcription factor n=1 Tax=Nocardioides lijunqiniae TaxID=2760832 RepID=UPI0018778356|nr:response regulator transcription factor [Nocardioides lijunqiniae]